MQEALAQVLQENANNATDELEASFEVAVMLFLRGDYRQAITKLQAVEQQARAKGATPLQGEVFKWMGHCWNRLSDNARAEGWFSDGVQFAQKHSLDKLQIDCLAGLGMMYRAQAETDKALQYLNKALELSEKVGDMDSKASMLCNLGGVLMHSDQDKALDCLQQAVALRELAIERLHEAGERAQLATAVMEHATAMVNLASALYVMKKMDEAKAAYEQALQVFELVEDVDKVTKVLVNLANMCDLQMADKPGCRREAAEFRAKLVAYLQTHKLRAPEPTCSVCLEALPLTQASAPGSEVILLSCVHAFHNKCWGAWGEKHAGGPVPCPTCKTPVSLYE